MKNILDICLKEKDKRAVQEAAETLKSRFPVARVVMFGSKAEGHDDPESDIDLLVLTTRELPWRERDAIINSLFDTQLKYDVVFGVLVVSEKEWEEGLSTVLPIHHEIEEHGVPI